MSSTERESVDGADAPNTPLSAALRRGTRAAHSKTEQTPVGRALARGSVTAEEYALTLFIFHALWSQLEGRLTELPALRTESKVPALERDLAVLGFRPDWVPEALRARARAVVEGLRGADARAVIAWAYVLEGSLLGGAWLRERVAAGLPVGARATSYYRAHGDDPRPHWQGWVRELDRVGPAHASPEELVAAANSAFDDVRELLTLVRNEDRDHAA
jgi:heme oxygenase